MKKGQSADTVGHWGSGSQPDGGIQPSGGAGQVGGELNTVDIDALGPNRRRQHTRTGHNNFGNARLHLSASGQPPRKPNESLIGGSIGVHLERTTGMEVN